MASIFEELNAKLTKAVEENTKAQAKATEMTGEHGKALRRLSRDTAQQKKRAAFMERDLKQELEDSLFAPFEALGKLIPKPLKLMAQMPFQAAMRGGGGGGGAAPRVDPSGTPMGPGNGLFHGAMGEAWGREISEKGLAGGTIDTIKGMIPGINASEDNLKTLIKVTVKNKELLEKIVEILEPKRVANLGRGSGFREPGIERKRLGAPILAGGAGTMGAGGGGMGGFGIGGAGAIDWKGIGETGAGVGGGLLGFLGLKKLLGIGKGGGGLGGVLGKLLGGAGGAGAVATGGGAAAAGGGAAAAGGLAALGGKMGVVGLLSAIAMTSKDIYDLSTSAEEKWAKGGENWGGIIGSLVGTIGFFGGPIIGGMTMMLGNTIGEMIGKAFDADRDPRVKAQMSALGAELDKLKDAREDVLDANMSNLLKQKKLTEIDKKIATVRTEAQEIEDRENEVERLELEKQRKILIEKYKSDGRIGSHYVGELYGEFAEKFTEQTGMTEEAFKEFRFNEGNRIKADRYYEKIRKGFARKIAAASVANDEAEIKRLEKLRDNQLKFAPKEIEAGDTVRKSYKDLIAKQEAKEAELHNAAIKKIDERLGVLNKETDEAAGMVDWEARLRGTDKGYNAQRTAVDVGPGLHDVPAGKGYGQHAQELMAGKEWEEFDPTQTKGAKAMQAMFGETSGLRPDFTKPGAVAGADFGTGHTRYTSDAYKAAVAASEGGEFDAVDDTLMAMQSVLSTGTYNAGPGITEDAKGKKMFKYSELQAMKERMGGYDDKFLTHRGEKIIGDEARTALQMDKLETDEWDPTKKDMGMDQWTEAQMQDDSMTAMGGPKIGQAKGGGRYLSSAAASGGLGLLNDEMLEFYGIQMDAENYSRIAGSDVTKQERDAEGKLIKQSVTDTYKGESGTSILSENIGSGKLTGMFRKRIHEEEEVTEGIGKDKTSRRDIADGMISLMFQTYKDGMYEIAYDVDGEAKIAVGQIKTKDDVENVIQNLADMTGESLTDKDGILQAYRRQLTEGLETGAWGFEDITKTGRIEQVGPHGDAWKLTEKGKEHYGPSFSQGGRQKGVPGAALGGTEEYRRAQIMAGVSGDVGEAPRDLLDPEAAVYKQVKRSFSTIGPRRGGRGQEYRLPGMHDRFDPTKYEGEGGTKPYMTTGGSSYVPAPPPPALAIGPEVDRTLRAALDPAVVAELLGPPAVPRSLMGTTTYALPPSTGVKATALADPYEGRDRDAGGRLIHEPQYRPQGVSDMENYPDYYWKQYGEAGHDPSKLSGDEISKLQEDYKKAGPTATPVALDEMTQEEIAEADKTTAQVLTDVKIGTKSSLGVTLVDPSGKVLELGQSLTKQSDVMYQGRMGGGEFTPEASAEERLYGGLGGMVTKMTTGEEVTDKELLATEEAAKEYQAEMAQVLSDVKVGAHSSLGVTIMDAAGKAAQFVSGILLAGGKEGDPLGQKTYAAHGQAGSLIKEQSQAGELGDPRGPGGYHERTGEDIAQQVEGSWHDYGMGMTVPLGLLASQLSSEFAKSLFREDETFAEAMKDPLGVVTAFKDASANIRGLQKGGYKTTSDLIGDMFSTAPASAGKRQIIDQAATAKAGATGGGTNVVVNAPSTSNSNSTVQKIDSNPLVSHNPRRPIGVHYG